MYPAGLLGAGQATAWCITHYLPGMALIGSRTFLVSRPSSSISWTGGLALLLTLILLAQSYARRRFFNLFATTSAHGYDQTLHVVAN